MEVETKVMYEGCPIDATIETGKISYVVVVVVRFPMQKAWGVIEPTLVFHSMVPILLLVLPVKSLP